MKKLTPFMIGILLFIHFGIFAQRNVLQLNFTAAYYGQYVPTDSIFIENLTSGCDTMLYYPDTTLMLDYITGINDNQGFDEGGFRVFQNRPNPFSGQTSIQVLISEPGQVTLHITNLLGQRVAFFEKELASGIHSFAFFSGREKYYILSVTFRGVTKAIKMVNLNDRGDRNSELSYEGLEPVHQRVKDTRIRTGFQYNPGDQLRFVGYSKSPLGVPASDVIEDSPTSNEDYVFEIVEGIPCPGIPALSYEGQIYTTVQIANQCWLKENLNVGTMIFSSGNQTNNGTIEKYCYDDDDTNCDVYGGLYQWSEMMQYYSAQGKQGICPAGWHIPTDNEFISLTNYLGGEAVACGKMKETGTVHWSSPNYGATNQSGFTAFPGGYFDPDYGFSWPSLSFYGSFWTSSESSDAPNAWARDLGYEDEFIIRYEFFKTAGMSVRCIKDVLSLPLITTAPVTNITQTTVTCGGEVSDDGGSEVTERGVCWSVNQNPTISDNHTTDGSGLGMYTSYLTGLTPNTPYFVRAFATNSVGTAYGNEVSFLTLPVNLPFVSTTAVTEITQTTATCGGEVTDDGGAEVTQRGVCWSVNQNPAISDNHTTDGSGIGIFTSYLMGLAPNTPYFVRAYATNSAGTAYGNEVTFSTLPVVLPIVTTTTITNITDTSAKSGGNVVFDGGSQVSLRGVCWSILVNPTIDDSLTMDGSGTGSFVSNLTGLSPNTTYFVRAYATNSAGTGYGDEESFTTLDSTGFICGDVVNYEGRNYNTILIGFQCWFKESLNVGTMINASQSQTNNGILEKYCYDNTEVNCDEYGGMYQWDEMMQYSTTPGIQGICPPTGGWHLPVDTDWIALREYLGGEYEAGGKLKEAGLIHWQFPNTGATNSSGFTGLPGGGFGWGEFMEITTSGVWWSSTEENADPTFAYSALLMHNDAGIAIGNSWKTLAISVRCMKQDDLATVPTVITSPVTGITQNSAICGGEVTDNGFEEVTARGICWSLHPNPTLEDNYTSDGTGTGIFVSNMIDLIQDTTYYVRAYATNLIGTAFGNEQTFMTLQATTFMCGDVVEYEGEFYPTILIGTQCWFKKNLNVGTMINSAFSQTNNGITEKCCYANLASNCEEYGGLYQWDEMMQYSSTPGVQGICPSTGGWHLPTQTEWTTLKSYLGGVSIAGGKLKEAGLTHWQSPNTGATNSSGFTGLPGGSLAYYNFSELSALGVFWSSTEQTSGSSNGFTASLMYDGESLLFANKPKINGFSVRCMKLDNSAVIPTVITSPVTGITQNSAICGGEVTDNGFQEVTARGVCWSLHPNPTLDDNHTFDGTGAGIFVSYLIDLIQDTTYYVRAYATNIIGTAYGDEQTFMTLQATTFMCGDVVEYEGEFYPTILIGTQCWFKKNLNVGTRINLNLYQADNGTVEKYCYENLEANCDVYGGLYQWNEMMQYSNTPGTQGICPSTGGWHLPTFEEWTTLTNYLGGLGSAGGKLKEQGTSHWAPPNTGATNSSGFTGLPGGSKTFWGGNCDWLGLYGYYWASSPYETGAAWYWELRFDQTGADRDIIDKIYGHSVRCTKD